MPTKKPSKKPVAQKGEPESGVLPPYAHDFLFGHEKIERDMRDLLMSRRLHHAWLIEGPRGLGKATLAWRAARFLLADDAPIGEGLEISKKSPAWLLTMAMSHPDFLLLTPAAEQKTQTITIDNVRAAQSFFSKSPALGRRRICIVDAVDNLNLNAANALLKLLEEPPDHAIFFLVSHNSGRVLATIRSRCRRLKLAPLADEDVQKTIKALAPQLDQPQLDQPDIELAARLAHGCPGRALAFAQGGGLKLHRDLYRLLASLPEVSFSSIQSFCASLSGKEQQKYDLFCDLMLDWIAASTRSQLQDPARVAQGLRLWDKISEIIRTGRRLNMDRSEAALNIFLALEEAKG